MTVKENSKRTRLKGDMIFSVNNIEFERMCGIQVHILSDRFYIYMLT